MNFVLLLSDKKDGGVADAGADGKMLRLKAR
jgi:hypothetical protein